MIDVWGLRLDDLSSVSLDQLHRLPRISAVYFARDEAGDVLYVGQTADLHSRWLRHHRLDALRARRCVRLCWLPVDHIDLLCIEAAAISHFAPRLNVAPGRSIENVPDPAAHLQAQLEAVFYKFYGNLDGILLCD